MTYEVFYEMRKLICWNYGLDISEESGAVLVPAGENPEVRDVQRFNNQFEGTIMTAPLILIDFGRLEFSALTKDSYAAPLNIRAYVVSQSLSLSDNQRHDQEQRRHDAIVSKLVSLFHLRRLASCEKPLVLDAIESKMDYAGYMVTAVDFKSRLKI